MVIKNKEMSIEKKEKMRSGEGIIEIKHLVNKELLKKARLMAYLTIPVSGSIGEHEHSNENRVLYYSKRKRHSK